MLKKVVFKSNKQKYKKRRKTNYMHISLAFHYHCGYESVEKKRFLQLVLLMFRYNARITVSAKVKFDAFTKILMQLASL